MSNNRLDSATVNALVNSDHRWNIVKRNVVEPWLPLPDHAGPDNLTRQGFPDKLSRLGLIHPESTFLGSKDHLTMLALAFHMNHQPRFDYSDSLPVRQNEFNPEYVQREFYSMTRPIYDDQSKQVVGESDWLSDGMFTQLQQTPSASPSEWSDPDRAAWLAKYAPLQADEKNWRGNEGNLFRTLDYFLDPNSIVIGFWQNDYLKKIGEFKDEVKQMAQARSEVADLRKMVDQMKRKFVETNEKLQSDIRLDLRRGANDEVRRTYLQRLARLHDEFTRSVSRV